jgi:ABC-type sugar transport systems, permease components
MKKFFSKNKGLLFIIPWLLGLVVFRLVPFALSLGLSFTDYQLVNVPHFIGLQNYKDMFANVEYRGSFLTTMKYVFLTVPFKLSFALFIAYILNFKIKGVNFFRTAYYIPSILGGSVAIAILWRFIFAADGLINIGLGFIGLPTVNWLGDTRTALFTVCLLRVWQFGSAMIIFLAALKNIPTELYEAAEIDGASKFSMFFRITLPMLTPVIFFNFVMQLVEAFQEFKGPYLITQGGPRNSTMLLPVLIYNNAFAYFKMGYASAIAWSLFLVIMVFTLFTFKSQKSWVHYSDD